MADRESSGIGRQTLTRRGPRRRSLTVPSLFVGLGLTLAACGGEATVSNEAAAPPPTTIPTTTTTTIPPTTTTTIDFNRPVNQMDTPLPEDALISEVAELVNDMRGQTDDLHQQMARLVDFPKIASPLGAQILDVFVVMTPGEDDIRTESIAVIRTPNGATNLVDYFDAEMVSRSWNEADVSTEVTDVGIRKTTVYRWPGTSGDDKEVTITVDPLPGLVLITIQNLALIDSRDESYDLLQGWQDKIRTPSSAEVTGAAISTSENVGIATVTYDLDAETAAEARSDMLGAVRTAEFETAAEPDETNGSPVTLTDVETGEEFLLEFAETSDEEIIEMTVSATFPLEPLD
jgi:hypothetical protein